MVVLDASAAVEWLFGTATGARIDEIINSPQEMVCAPHLIDLEVAQVLRRWTFASKVSTDRASQALQDLMELRLVRYPHYLLTARVWQLRNNLSAYDAAYVALAEVLNARLVTRDRRLATAPGLRARIEIVD